MRENMSENLWSPFDPEWYNEAFDRYVSTDDELFNTNTIIEMGFDIPDSDRSKSSVFYKDSVLNNSFNEGKLRDTLKDIYLNSTHKMRASNHDNIGYYQWHGEINDCILDNKTDMLVLEINNSFIQQGKRNSYKMSQYYGKWIKAEELINDKVFDFTILFFINKRVYTDFEIYIDDRQILFRFKYQQFWLSRKYKIDLYKFYTNYKKRIKISKFQYESMGKKLPLTYLEDYNFEKCICYVNKISDTSIRTDGNEYVDSMGYNLDFIKTDDFIDLNQMSNLNKSLIESEEKESVWLTVIVPKFFHEYPILLPVENIYREYHPNLISVYTQSGQFFNKVRDNENNEVFVDLDDYTPTDDELWLTMIRPIVLSDAFIQSSDDPYDTMDDELKELRIIVVELADKIDKYRFFIKEKRNIDEFKRHTEELKTLVERVRNAYYKFMNHIKVPIDKFYKEVLYKFLNEVYIDLNKKYYDHEMFHVDEKHDKNFFRFISPLVHIPQSISQRYYISEIIKSMQDKRNIWENKNKFLDKIRFTRPIDSSDFFFMEYDIENRVWLPSDLEVEYHFPDSYILKDKTGKDLKNRIFKAFIFYSDIMNVVNEAVDRKLPSSNYDTDMESFEYNKKATYRNIFIEKFYWAGINTIYGGSLRTKSKWELILYIYNNPSYKRFNELFINTMEPYFKLGWANYLKNDNFLFALDYMVSKMNDSIKSKMMNYDRITNYQIYLNKTWEHSYFDYITKIDDRFDYSERIVKRPPFSFDIQRILNIVENIRNDVETNSKNINLNLKRVIGILEMNLYSLNKKDLSLLKLLKELIDDVNHKNTVLRDFILEFDLDIYSIKDTRKILDSLSNYTKGMDDIKNLMKLIYEEVISKSVYEEKRKLVTDIKDICNLVLSKSIDELGLIEQTFDMNTFMFATNNLDTLSDSYKKNDKDISLVGYINKFQEHYSDEIKEIRTKIFISTTKLNSMYKKDKSFSKKEIEIFINVIEDVENSLKEINITLNKYWDDNKIQEDKLLLDKIAHSSHMIKQLKDSSNIYYDKYKRFQNEIDSINSPLDKLKLITTGEKEKEFIPVVEKELNNLISSVSYICGKNKPQIAHQHNDSMKEELIKWTNYINEEQDLIENILSITKLPSTFTNLIEKYFLMLINIEKCLNSLELYRPDILVNDYLNIYEVNDFKLIDGGFNSEYGEKIYVPNVGVFSALDIKPESGEVEELRNLNIRRTTFRNPLSQDYPYFSISDKQGLNVRIEPTSIKMTPVINDEPLEKFILLSKEYIERVKQSSEILSYLDNINLSSLLSKINKLNKDWNSLKDIYGKYMSDNKIKVDSVLSLLSNLNTPINEYIDIRKNINIDKLVYDVDIFILNSYKIYKENKQLSGNYLYYNDKLRAMLYKLSSFLLIDNSSIEDSIKIVEEMKSTLYNFKINTLDRNNFEELNKEYEDISKLIEVILHNLSIVKSKQKQIRSLSYGIESIIRKIPEKFTKDLWYFINELNIGIGGSGYRIGDIIEIIPELPINHKGETIKDQEDLIYNDIILFQVTRVDDNGSILKVKPFIEYALPYPINGPRKSKNRVGSGVGAVINIKTNQIQYKMNSIFRNKKDVLNKFTESDLLNFKFENIHDLAINYEVFFGGIQREDFIFRHLEYDKYDKENHHLYPKKFDVIYVNANDLLSLNNNSIDLNDNDFYLYKLKDVQIVDPGAGYYVGQTIYVNTKSGPIKLVVKELDGSPMKGIKSIDLETPIIQQNGINPTAKRLSVIPDDINNIDDEYNEKSRNSTFMNNFKINNRKLKGKGDPDGKWFLGSRIDNSFTNDSSDIWNGIINNIPPTNPFIKDQMRIPKGMTVNGEYQKILRSHIHNETNNENTKADLYVNSYKDLPQYTSEWKDVNINKSVIVENDVNYDNHRMKYNVRSFILSGLIIYDEPEFADISYNKFKIDWMNIDSYPDIPSLNSQYKSENWRNSKTFLNIKRKINDKEILRSVNPKISKSTFIHRISKQDISVYNHTTNEWEDLFKSNRWKLVTYYDNDMKKWGFELIFLETGKYSYDMTLFLNKTSSNQLKNTLLKRNAVLNIKASLENVIERNSESIDINTGKNLRIRKLFPYRQESIHKVGKDSIKNYGYEIDVELNNYIHYRNELHLEDIKIFNITANRYENLLDKNMFEVRFKDDKYKGLIKETKHNIVKTVISIPGSGFIDGPAYAYNLQDNIYLHGNVVTNKTDGSISTFIPTTNPKIKNSKTLEFVVYQSNQQNKNNYGRILVEFNETIESIVGDGYIHNVTNRLAPLPKKIKIVCMYDLQQVIEYKIIISKNPNKWEFINETNSLSPSFKIENENISYNRLYVSLNNKGRLPIINPQTLKPTMEVSEMENGTSIKLLSVYGKNSRVNIHSTPYPMRSVYVQRNIPKNGYINLEGKLNKPLDKKYFEFWVNGRLLDEEVNIITPTKIILHGLKSLKNLEILEINRDNNEYFSDVFFENKISDNKITPQWNLKTYLDDVLEGNLKGENFRLNEQEALLTPVWNQVDTSHPEYKNYPHNIDIEEDILLVSRNNTPNLNDIGGNSYQYMVTDIPSIGKVPLLNNITFDSLGFEPLTESELIDILNEEWKEEIDKGLINNHISVVENVWYGLVVKMYNKFGQQVYDINECDYKVYDDMYIKISVDDKLIRIIKNNTIYDLN